jgi:thiol-disulfide isomerase/thioredoxin
LLAWDCLKIAAFCYHWAMTNLRAYRWLGGLALAALALFFVRYEHDAQYRTLRTGDRLHPLRVASLYGSPYTIAPQGRPMVINVFATWCGPCRAEAPGFANAAGRLHALGIDLVGIDQQESGAQVQAFAHAFGISYPLYVDGIGITHSVLGARVIPTTIYIDAHGIIRWEHAGPISGKDLLALPLAAENNDES